MVAPCWRPIGTPSRALVSFIFWRPFLIFLLFTFLAPVARFERPYNFFSSGLFHVTYHFLVRRPSLSRPLCTPYNSNVRLPSLRRNLPPPPPAVRGLQQELKVVTVGHVPLFIRYFTTSSHMVVKFLELLIRNEDAKPSRSLIPSRRLEVKLKLILKSCREIFV